MKRHNEDKLIELAFGELTASEAERLRVELDAQAVATVERFEAIRADMARLSVPDHQLSTQRLRDAILSEGLSPQRKASAPWWRFAWAPVAALALGYITIQSLQRPAFDDPVVAIADTTSTAVASDASTSPIDFDPAVSAPISRSNDAVIASDQADSTPAVARPSRRPRAMFAMASRSGAERMSLSMKSEAEALANSVVNNAVSAKESPNDSGMTMATMAVPDSARIEPAPSIVLIGNERDALTGASKAVEVSSASNVVIGG